MAKQTMGFSGYALKHPSDIKECHLQTPQTPIVRTATYSNIVCKVFQTGTDAIVVVLAYTGYDMEDAMILNKSSVVRWLSRGLSVFSPFYSVLPSFHCLKEPWIGSDWLIEIGFKC